MRKSYLLIILTMTLAFPMLLSSAEIRVTANITADTYWTANNTYILDKMVYVEPKASLFIEAGTVVKGASGQESNAKALIVSRGAKIFAEGTATQPIIFTAEADDITNPFDLDSKTVGQWGGLVLLGNAPVNAPGGEANFEGIDPNPLTLYGGPDSLDCSGVLKYVSIRHGGTQIGAGKEINALSLAGVGKGTVISYVEAYANGDDAFEWWGGNSRCDHLVAAFCQDDAIDLDEGNQSKMQYVFVIQDVNGDEKDTRVGEHDGSHKSTIGGKPISYTSVYNATYLGAGKAGAKAHSVFKLREYWGGEYRNSIFGDFNGIAVEIDGKTTPDSKDRILNGSITFTNNIWFDLAAGSDWKALSNSVDYVENYFSNAANKNDITDPKLAGISREFNSNKLDPRPAVDGPAYQDVAALPENDDFFEYAPYKGAFGPTNWLKSWTALDHYGYVADDKISGAVIEVTGNITKDTHWTADNVYVLKSLVYVEAGATLFIEAGTIIKGGAGQESESKSLFVSRGAKIVADGTGAKPIIFTSEADDVANPFDIEFNAAGQWGGLVLLGYAPINAPGGEANFEGIDPNPNTLYGGTNPNDCSGLLRYVSVRHGGTQIGAGKEINGVSFAGVGRKTKVSYVEAYSNADDAFEWWGGSPRCDHLVAALCQDDAIDFDEGNQSPMQYLFVLQNENGDEKDTRIGEHDGCHKSSIGGQPEAHPVIFNATYLGGGKTGPKAHSIFKMRENWGGEYKNSIFGDFNGIALDIEGKTTPDSKDRLAAGDLVFQNNLWFEIAAGNDWNALANNVDYIVSYFSNAANKNEISDPKLAQIGRTPKDNGLDPRPAFAGAAYQEVNPTAVAANSDVFQGAAYKGAFGPTNWLKGWTALDHYGTLKGSTGVASESHSNTVVSNYSLEQNFPNPFNPVTSITYSIPATSQVKLVVYDIQGKEVETLVNSAKNAGTHRVVFDASKLASGMYFYRLETNAVVLSRKLILVK
ncbi:T9SS type A sorting domain-containing protein [candidate division KSB1 bacterium]|nr:T9SS type A sorting domain-containing protein [candidate division KSB1 bacterium]